MAGIDQGLYEAAKVDGANRLQRIWHITLPGKPETLTASGAALAAGIMLSPLFRGTGYAPEQRTQGDFGSDVYLIEESDGE